MLSTHQHPEGLTSQYPHVCTYETLARQAIGGLACLLNVLLHIKYSTLERQLGRRIVTQHACIEVCSLLQLLELAG
jgi:hypothetical protein